jgi:ubiquinone/menaquinone biosynthesis C-methylase UbiE
MRKSFYRLFEGVAEAEFPESAVPFSLASPMIGASVKRGASESVEIPGYLEEYYWWAYVHPNAVRVFERQWLVNALLWGKYPSLRDAALDALGDPLHGRTLQIGCAYGDISNRLCDGVSAGSGDLDVVDALPVQLENLRNKLPMQAPVRRLLMDSAALDIPDASYDRAILFFLLHEQPEAWRRNTLSEALRVVKRGGRIVIVDYARPRWWNPIRYLFGPLLDRLEPFALDLWRSEIAAWLPEPWASGELKRRSFFGGLYQQITLER